MTRRGWGGMLVAALTLVATSDLYGQAIVTARPIFGDACVARGGAIEVLVGIQNTTGETLAGTVRVDATGAYAQGVRTVHAVDFHVAARSLATVRIPTPLGSDGAITTLTVVDGRGRTLSQQPLHFDNPVDNLFVDATPGSRLAYALRAANFPDPAAAPSIATSRLAGLGVQLTPCSVDRVAATGDVVLPRTPEGFNGVRMMVIDSTTLIGLGPTERSALADWVLEGGTLTVLPMHVDDLRHATLASFIGNGITAFAPPPVDVSTSEWYGALPEQLTYALPQADTVAHIQTFSGGHLQHRTLAPLFPWGPPEYLGATAEYGFGHVHVLSINPTSPPGIEDPWAVGVVTHLAEQTTRHDDVLGNDNRVPTPVRRFLDPNEAFRPGLGAAVVALLLYAVLAGPLSFRLARRRKRPLRALMWLPVWSVALFAYIVILGGVSRGFQGHARRLAIFELPAGMARGRVHRYHGYFSGDAGGMRIHALGSPRMTVDPSAGTGFVTLTLGRGESLLSGVAITPWTTLAVSESGVETLPGFVSLLPDTMGQVRIVNHLRYALRDVIVLAPGAADAWTFREIAPNGSRVLTAGTRVATTVLGSLATGSWPDATYGGDNTAFRPGWQVASLFGSDTDRVQIWDAVVAAVPNIGLSTVAQPVLLARVIIPRGDETDGGLRVDRDEMVVRVAGWGGAP